MLEIVADKTGYPPDMLEMDLDLEADLGVDTVKQAETFAAVREAYGIARQENLKLRDFPTLKHVVEFVYQFRPDLEAPSSRPISGAALRFPPNALAEAARPQSRPGRRRISRRRRPLGPAARLEDADKMPRRVPVPSLCALRSSCASRRASSSARARASWWRATRVASPRR